MTAIQLDLPNPEAPTKPARKHHYDGETFDRARDGDRLDSLLRRVFRLMRDGQWRTFDQIRAVTGGKETSISARLRDFRKPEKGGHTVESREVSSGNFEYRLIVNLSGVWMILGEGWE